MTIPAPIPLRRLAVSGAYAVADQGLFATSNFVVNLLLARWLSPREYGAFAMAYVILVLIQVGHSSLIVEPMLVHGPGKYAARLPAYLRVLLRYQFLFGIVAAAATAVLALVLDLFGAHLVARTLLGQAVATSPIFLCWFARRACYIEGRSHLAAYAGVVYLAMTVGGAAVLYQWQLLTPLSAQLVMGAGALGAALVILRSVMVRYRHRLSTDERVEIWNDHKIFARWTGASGFFSWVQSYILYLVLPLWHGLEAAAAVRALTNFVMPLLQSDSALTTLLAPELARARARTGGLSGLLRWAMRVFLIEGLVYWIVIVAFRHQLVEYAYGAQYAPYADLLIVLGGLPLLASRASLCGIALRALERTRVLFFATAIAAVTSLVLAVSTLAFAGVTGAVWATVLATLTQVAVMTYVLRPYLQTRSPNEREGLRSPVGEMESSAPRATRVLISAYACGPGTGSEPAVGWNAAREVARQHDVWVMTCKEHQRSIENELSSRPVPTLHFVFFDWPAWLAPAKRTHLGCEMHYALWQLAAFVTARRLHRQVTFDVVHHVTFCRYWTPSLLPLLRVPFVWGPVGGGESAPVAFWRGLGYRGAMFEAVRVAVRWLGECNPLLRFLARRTAIAAGTTPETYDRLRKLGTPQTHLLSQVALSDSELARLAPGASLPPGPIRFISVGRLEAWKGIHLGLRAFAHVRNRAAEYWIVGDGIERETLRALAIDLGVSDRVRFLGWMDRDGVASLLQECHVLVHPSLHDSGGMVCAEAMAAGRPVLCLDLGGPGQQVSPESGFKIRAVTPDDAVERFAEAMNRLSDSPELRSQMGEAARARATNEFHWRQKGEQFSLWYGQATATLGPSLLRVTT